MATVRIGISGWRYPSWRGRFYPTGLPQRQELAYAAARFPSIELNGTFYALQRPERFAAWRDATPRRFVFAVKGPRYVTHQRRLREARVPLANFFASGVLALGPKLGPILWQLPPTLAWDRDLIERFLRLLPHDTRQAAALAEAHDAHVCQTAWLPTDGNHRVRHALEVRHESFRDRHFIAQLRRHGVALVVADTAGRWPLIEDVTAGFLYLRLHGEHALYAGGYNEATLAHWARRIWTWSSGAEPVDAQRVSSAQAPRRSARDVYVYFDNDADAHAAWDAAALLDRLGLEGPHSGAREA